MAIKVYFGHPINTYGTELEKRLLETIGNFFKALSPKNPDLWIIENPNQRHHQEGCRIWREKTGNGMNYFFKCVLPECDAGIFLPFRDGKWGAGIFGEAEWLVKHGCPIWEITHDGKIRKLECLYDIQVLCNTQVLSVEETRKRIRDANGQPLPY